MLRDYILILLTAVFMVSLVSIGGYICLDNLLMFFWSCISVGLSAGFYMGINILFKLGE